MVYTEIADFTCAAGLAEVGLARATAEIKVPSLVECAVLGRGTKRTASLVHDTARI